MAKQVTLKQIKEAVFGDIPADNNMFACDLCSRFFQLAHKAEKEGKDDVAKVYEKKALRLYEILEEVGYYDN